MNTKISGSYQNWRRVARVALYVCLVVLTLLSVAPMIWMLSTSLKTTGEIFSGDLNWIPRNPTLENFSRAVEQYPLGSWMFNSILIAAVTIVLTVITHVTAAYAIAKISFRFQPVLMMVLLATIMLPRELTAIPVYSFIREWNMMDTHAAVILPQIAEAITVFLLVQFFSSLPDEYVEAAKLDGANHWTILWRIFVPLAWPVVSVVIILAFVNSWNNFFWPLLVTFTDQSMPLPVGLSSIMASYSESSAARQYGLLMAISLIAAIPTVAAFLALQKKFVEAVTSSGIKG